MDLIEKAEQIHKEHGRDVYIIYEDGTKEKRRIGMTSSNEVLLMIKGSRKKGYYLRSEARYMKIKDILPVIKREKPKDHEWKQQLDRAIDMLEKSGLWEHVLRDMKIARDIGYDKLKQAYQESWKKHTDNYEENEKIRLQKVKEIEPRLIRTNDEGKEHFNTDILWQFSNTLKIKKMYFGKYQNAHYLEEIKRAMSNQEKYNTGRVESNYDVSFEYNPEHKRAWYSEEYRGCGNGHYYLALNSTHAIHYEDD